jgi:hypothetical protein
LPKLISENLNVMVAEGGNAVPVGRGLSQAMSSLRMLKRLAGVLVTAQVLPLIVLRRNTMGVRGVIVQFGGALVILVVRATVIAGGHSERPNPPRLIVGFLRKFVGVIRVFQSSFRMPRPRFVISFFVMFSSRTVRARREFVLLCRLPV